LRARERVDDQAIHDVRVLLRRGESVLDVWRAAIGRRARARLLRRLKRLRRDLSAARDAEVLVETLRALLRSTPDGEAARGVLRDLEQRRERLRARAAKRCRAKRVRKLSRRIRRAAGVMGESGTGAAELRAAAQVVERRRRRAHESIATLPPEPEPGALHSARLRIKRWRYAEELLGMVQEAGRAADWQDRLGALHDLMVLRGFLEDGPGLAALLRALDARVGQDWSAALEQRAREANAEARAG
jgi:CHAD domain-containing protein